MQPIRLETSARLRRARVRGLDRPSRARIAYATIYSNQVKIGCGSWRRAFVLTIVLGCFFGRWFVRPLLEIIEVTRAAPRGASLQPDRRQAGRRAGRPGDAGQLGGRQARRRSSARSATMTGLGLDGQQRAQLERAPALPGVDRAGGDAPGDRRQPAVGRRLGRPQRPARQGHGPDGQRGQRPGREGGRGGPRDRRRHARDHPEDPDRRRHRLPDQPARPERGDRGGPGRHARQGIRGRRRRGPQARRAEPGRRAADQRPGQEERRRRRERRPRCSIGPCR